MNERIVIRECVESAAADLARLRWTWRSEGRPTPVVDIDGFIRGFSQWWEQRGDVVAYLAIDSGKPVAMAFLALVRRVPDPSALLRRHGDIQSVYVLPAYRNQGIGSKLVRALVDHARKAGCLRITVHSGSAAIPVYERAGFQQYDHLLVHPLTD